MNTIFAFESDAIAKIKDETEINFLKTNNRGSKQINFFTSSMSDYDYDAEYPESIDFGVSNVRKIVLIIYSRSDFLIDFFPLLLGYFTQIRYSLLLSNL